MLINKLKNIKSAIKHNFLNLKYKSSGATLIEYALILSLISVVLIASYKKLGRSYSDIYNKIAVAVDNAGNN